MAIFIQTIETVILLTLALISDIKTHKIKNYIVYPFILLGFATNTVVAGIDGAKSSFFGLLTPVMLFIIFYMLRMLGAGDIKLLGAVGAIMGAGFVIQATVYTILCGGAIAVVILIARRNGKQRLAYLLQYIKGCILTYSFQPYTDFEDKGDGAKFRFAYAIFIGTMAYMIIKGYGGLGDF